MYEPNEYDSEGQMTYHHHSAHNSGAIHGQLEPAPYIVNGKDTEMREFPWQISLQTKAKSQHRCGGTIINSRYYATSLDNITFLLD